MGSAASADSALIVVFSDRPERRSTRQAPARQQSSCRRWNEERTMMSRRTALHGTALTGLLTSLAAPAEGQPVEAAAAQKETEQAIQEGSRALARAVQDLKDELKRQNDFWELAPLRDPIKMFLR